MNWLRRLILFVSLVALPAAAQDARVLDRDVGPSGQAYDQAVRFRGIDSDVLYYDPAGPVPPLETRAAPRVPPAPQGEVDPGPVRTVFTLAAIAVLAGLALLLFRFGGGMTLSLGSQAANPARGAARNGAVADAAPAPIRGLSEILAMSDRRAALIALAQKALAAAVSANGVILQRSWTLRDALARVPADQRHAGALRALVMDSEGVHFGNRDVSEDQFTAHVSAIRPLLEGART